jgi:hypothetical protein
VSFIIQNHGHDWPRQRRRAISTIMYHRLLTLLSSTIFLSGCSALFPQEGSLFFKYSFWRSNNNTFSDIGCLDTDIERIRADLFFRGVRVGGAEAVCGAFGNEDGVNNLDELGEFLSDIEPTTFDQLQITVLRGDGTLLPFGLRVNDADRPIAQQQTILFAYAVELSAEQQLNISLPGEAGSQIDNELQMIIP